MTSSGASSTTAPQRSRTSPSPDLTPSLAVAAVVKAARPPVLGCTGEYDATSDGDGRGLTRGAHATQLSLAPRGASDRLGLLSPRGCARRPLEARLYPRLSRRAHAKPRREPLHVQCIVHMVCVAVEYRMRYGQRVEILGAGSSRGDEHGTPTSHIFIEQLGHFLHPQASNSSSQQVGIGILWRGSGKKASSITSLRARMFPAYLATYKGLNEF